MPLRIAALVLATLALVGGVAAAQPRDLPERGPVGRLVAHEWGVFVLEAGRIAHLQEIGAELPPFVHRGAGPLAGPPPRPRPDGVVARKPVLFLYADTPMPVRVEVGFAGGEPWFHYPLAQRVRSSLAPNAAGLVWDVHVAPGARPGFAAAPAGHFWEDLRRVGADPVLSPDGTAEAFLFYDGPVAFERPFLIGRHGTGAAVTPVSTERTLFLVDRGLYTESDVDRSGWRATPRSSGDMIALRSRLDAELRARGLTAAESTSLLETWRDDLFTDPRPRAIYFVPRDAYDRMLPLRITPTPTDLVRVALVIDRL